MYLCKYHFFQNRGLDPQRGANDVMSPDHPNPMNQPQQQQAQSRSGNTATPTMQQRIKPLGVATPLVMASPVRRYVCIHSVTLILLYI